METPVIIRTGKVIEPIIFTTAVLFFSVSYLLLTDFYLQNLLNMIYVLIPLLLFSYFWVKRSLNEKIECYDDKFHVYTKGKIQTVYLSKLTHLKTGSTSKKLSGLRRFYFSIHYQYEDNETGSITLETVHQGDVNHLEKVFSDYISQYQLVNNHSFSYKKEEFKLPFQELAILAIVLGVLYSQDILNPSQMAIILVAALMALFVKSLINKYLKR